jgi:hypothetical protein
MYQSFLSLYRESARVNACYMMLIFRAAESTQQAESRPGNSAQEMRDLAPVSRPS